MPDGKFSSMVVVPVELDGPLLVTVILYWPPAPAVNVPTASFVTIRSKTELSVVVGVETGPLLAPFVSPGLLRVTVLAGSGFAAPAEIDMSSNKKLSPPEGIEFVFVQETFGTAPVQVHV